jgi:hypothetical protein
MVGGGAGGGGGENNMLKKILAPQIHRFSLFFPTQRGSPLLGETNDVIFL